MTKAGGDRLLAAAGGVCGAAGVALAAAAAHRGGGDTAIAANFLLFHAPAFLAIGLASTCSRPLKLASWLLFAGLVVFAGDLVCRDYAGTRLFPYAAPLGGSVMIVAWVGVAIAVLMGRGQSAD